MFGHNIVAGSKHFLEKPEARAGKLLVTSIFRTLQGEGPYAGIPAIFVRLALCQLRCSFCDTYFDSGDWMDNDEVLDAIDDVRGGVKDLIVVTGGEPTLQPGLGKFIEYALEAGSFQRAQIETNGLLEPIVPEGTCVVMSPKCAERLGAPTHYLRPPAAALARADCLKFVVTGDPASIYHAVPDWALDWRRQTGRAIYVSPMAEYRHAPGQTQALYDARRTPTMGERTAAEKVSFWEPGLLDMDKCRRNYEYAAGYAVDRGLRLSIQMHLFASMP